jgi:hypothetical protein
VAAEHSRGFLDTKPLGCATGLAWFEAALMGGFDPTLLLQLGDEPRRELAQLP